MQKKKATVYGPVYRQMVTPLWVDKQQIPGQVSFCNKVTLPVGLPS